jgi:DNA invertase Pin-like site-specific DNA recombinase
MGMPPITREIQIAGYGRMSTDKQQISPEVQRDMIQQWFDYQMMTNRWPNGARFIGMFIDHAVTSKIDLLNRKSGEHLMTTLNAGDIVVVAKYNRAFRSAADAERTLDRAEEAGIKFVFLDLHIDTTQANGKMMAGIMAVVSKHERDLRSETTRDALSFRRKKGYATHLPPHGWKIGSDGKLVVDIPSRTLALAARSVILQGVRRDYLSRAIRPFYKAHKMKHGWSPQGLVNSAAASCLQFKQTVVREEG